MTGELGAIAIRRPETRDRRARKHEPAIVHAGGALGRIDGALGRIGGTHLRIGGALWRWLAVVILLVSSSSCALFRGSNPIPGIDVVFHGNSSLGKSELLDAIAPDLEGYEKSEWKKSLVDDAAYDLERYYNSQGFPFASVSYDHAEPEGKKPRAEFTIVEGPRARLGSVTFRGNTAIGSDKLGKTFESEGLAIFGSKQPWYVEDRVRAGADEVARLYYEQGYLEVAVSPPQVAFENDGKLARVTIEIREGMQHHLASVSVEGDLVFPEADLEKTYSSYIGKPYVEHLSVEIQGRIEEYHSNRGYADVVVKRVRRDAAADGAISLVYEVTPGTKVHVGEVHVTGNARTRTSFIKNRLELKPGDEYDREKEHESFRKLYRSGIFESVHLGLASTGGDTRDLDVDVKEAPSVETYIEPGYGSYERLRLSAGVKEKNLFGTGRILQLDGVVGAYAQNAKASLIDPWFFNDLLTATYSVFAGRRIEPSFISEEVGTSVTLAYDLSRQTQITGGYSFRYSASSDVDIVTFLANGEVANVNISSFIFGITHDTRDVVFNPKTGQLSKLSCEIADQAIGSELSFVRLNGTEAGFLPLTPSTVFAASFRTGVIIPTDNTTSIPIQERYFNGGENTVRSFLEDQLGPKDINNAPIGGEAYSVLSFEVRQKLVGAFQGALFWDLGNVVLDHADYFRFPGIRQGIGVGLRYELPVGPIRLDGALNPDPQPGEANGAVHFTVGMAF
jgi:outer membrane protein assembly complex protein YaeT